MAQFQTQETFVNGELVTGNRLNNIIGQATALGGLITEQPSLSGVVENSDKIIIHADGALKNTTVQNLFQSDIPIKTQLVEGDSLALRQTVQGQTLTLGNPLIGLGAYPNHDVYINGNTIIDGNYTEITNLLKVSGNLDTSGTIESSSTSHFKIPAGNDAQRPSVPAEGQMRYNTTLKRLEFRDNSSWVKVPTDADLAYKTFTKQVTGAPGVSDWVSAENTWQWRTSADVTVPAGEVWEYTVWVSGGSYGWGNTRPERNHHARLYIGDTIARDVQCRISTYSGQWFAVLKINVASADTSPAKKIGLKFVKGEGVGAAGIRSGAEGLQIVVSVTKRKLSDDTEIGQIL